MEEEVAALKSAMNPKEIVTYASMQFCKGMLCGKEVVVVRSGIGKVNAAICAQILIDKFEIDMLMNSDLVSWININRRGGVAYVSVADKIVYEENEETKGF